MICVQGSARITDLVREEGLLLAKGTAVVIPAAVEQYSIEGQAMIYKAFVPLS